MITDFNFKKTFLITMIISLCISAIVGIFLFLFGNFGEIEIKILLTTLIIGGYSLTGLCCSILYEKRRFIPLALLGIIISVSSFLYTIMMIWELINISEYKILIILIVLAVSTAHSCLILLIKSEKLVVNGVLLSVIILNSIIALMLIIFIIYDRNEFYFYYRLLGVFSILDILGTIVAPILNKVYSIEN